MVELERKRERTLFLLRRNIWKRFDRLNELREREHVESGGGGYRNGRHHPVFFFKGQKSTNHTR